MRGRGKDAMGGVEGEAGDVRKEGGQGQGGNELRQDDWWIASNKKFTGRELNLRPCNWKKRFASMLTDTPYQLNLYSSAELYR